VEGVGEVSGATSFVAYIARTGHGESVGEVSGENFFV
jgi:hypothetical protein